MVGDGRCFPRSGTISRSIIRGESPSLPTLIRLCKATGENICRTLLFQAHQTYGHSRAIFGIIVRDSIPVNVLLNTYSPTKLDRVLSFNNRNLDERKTPYKKEPYHKLVLQAVRKRMMSNIVLDSVFIVPHSS
jgi:hypothetical protein